jgi:hypothetical protein
MRIEIASVSEEVVTNPSGCAQVDLLDGEYNLKEVVKEGWSVISEPDNAEKGENETDGEVIITIDGSEDTFTFVNDSPPENTTQQRVDVQVCKEDETGTPVEGWTMNLGGEADFLFQEDIVVDSQNSEGTNTNILEAGVTYDLIVSGTWNNGSRSVDAEYFSDNNWETRDNFEGVPGRDDQQLNLVVGAQHDWQDVDGEEHTYRMRITGDGSAINLRIYDEDNDSNPPSWYNDNSGSLEVDIYQITTKDQSLETELDQQGTQACVTFADVPYGEYTLSEETRAEEGWTVQTEPGNDGVNTGEDTQDGVVILQVNENTEEESYTFVNQAPEEEPQTPPEEETPNEEQPPEEQSPDEPEGEAVLEHSTYIEEESPVETVANGTRYMSTSTITNTGTSVLTNITAITAPIEGAEYVSGSWTGTETEPTFSSPGTWTIGTLQPGESRTISYTASIDDNQEQGLYKDLVWVKGTDENGTEIVSEGVASRYVNASFVGDEIRITADAANVERERINIEQERTEEVTEEGEVLGASTGLPATGAKTLWVILASILTMLGGGLVMAGMVLRKTQKKTPRLHPITKSFPSGSIVRSLGVLLAFAFITGFLITGKTFAADLDIRLEDQSSPTGQDNFKLSFTTLDILGRDVQVKCYKKAPTETDFVQFDGTKSLPGGGGSGACSVDQSIVNQQGTYQFYTIAQAGADEQSSEVISVDYDTEAGPGTPVSYDKSKSGCTYTISFKTADDDGETARVELYRSEDTDFPIDAGTRVASTDIGSNETAEFEDTPGDCGKEYYYAIRAFDTVGNASGVVGDTIINVTTITTTTTTTTTDGGTTDNVTTEQADTGTEDTGGAIPVDNANIPPEEEGEGDALVADDEEGDVQGAQDDGAEEDDRTDDEETEEEETENETTEEDNGTADGTEEDGDVLGETDETGGNSNAMVYVSIFGATVIFGILAYFFLIRNKAQF